MDKKKGGLFSKREDAGDHWMSISDLMAGLMMVFLFIAIAYMINVKDVAQTYQSLKKDLFKDLMTEFEKDLPGWNAGIDSKTLSIHFRETVVNKDDFREPAVFFGIQECAPRQRFLKILNDFFPRYLSILTQEKYCDEIEEVRIEGHTSSEWGYLTGTENAYFKNMELSQCRTRSVLQFIMGLPEVKSKDKWMIEHVTANGLSYSQMIVNEKTGKENTILSRRVEFRVRTKADEKIEKILERTGG